MAAGLGKGLLAQPRLYCNCCNRVWKEPAIHNAINDMSREDSRRDFPFEFTRVRPGQFHLVIIYYHQLQ